MAVYRVYVEKSPEYAVEAQGLLKEIRHILLIKSVTGVRVLGRYDVEGIARALFERCMPVVLSLIHIWQAAKKYNVFCPKE